MDALRLYVLWSPGAQGSTSPGARLAHAFGERLDAVGMVRDGIGFHIPVRQRSVPWQPASDPVTPRKITLADSRSNIIIAVYDDVMAARPAWWKYLNEIQTAAAQRGGRDLLIMLLLTSDKDPPNAWADIQAIRAPPPVASTPPPAANPSDAGADWSGWLRRAMLNILARALDQGAGPPDGGPKKIRVFLSHAKADGENAALLIDGFRRVKPDEQINSIDMFFDSSDTLAGARYDDQFRGAIEKGVFLALVTDAYHARRWCQWELLLAKEHQRPIVIWDRLQKGNLRSFPYFGNVPVVRARDVHSNEPLEDAEIEELLLTLLLEALRIQVWKDYAGERIAARAAADGSGKIALFARPPELTDIAFHRRTKDSASIIVYPDPPIGQDERALLSAADPDVQLLALSELLR
jgi:hypothetical protein